MGQRGVLTAWAAICGSLAASQAELLQIIAQFTNDRWPVRERSLPVYSGCRVPYAAIPGFSPAPVPAVLQQYPCWPPQRTRQVCNRCVDRDNEITVFNHRRSIGEILLLGPKVTDAASSHLFKVNQLEIFLQADELAGQREQGLERCQRDTTLG